MAFRFGSCLLLALGFFLTVSFVATMPTSAWHAPQRAETNLPLAAVNGPQRTLVILVRFPDKNNNTTPSTIGSMMVSLNNYYSEDSYGTVSFQTVLSPATNSQWYSLPQSMGYYGADSVSSDNQLVSDSLQAVYNSGVDLSSYKFAMVVHAGSDEAMTHITSDIHSFTIPGYIFNPAPLVSYRISTSVVSESDPVGVYAHECGHLLGLPDLYDLTGQIDSANNFLGYWEIMALGEWNPNNGNPLQPKPGTYPSHHSSWSKIQLGFIPGSRIANVSSGNSANITVQDLEFATAGIQAVKIPIGVNSDGSLTYYLVEMRARLGAYDQYLPFPTDYPSAGLLIYKVNESIPNGHGSVRLIDAHPGGDLSDAGFGPCFSPCVSNNTYWDQANFVKIIVANTTATAYSITVDRTSSPALLLQVNTPSPGVLVSVDGRNLTSDTSKQLRVVVHYGPHTLYIQPQIPISLGSTSIQVGLTNSFAAWDDGNTANPRWVSVEKDIVLTATYRIVIEPSFSIAATAAAMLAVVASALTLHRRRRSKHSQQATQPVPYPAAPKMSPQQNQASFPGNNSLPGRTVENNQESYRTQP